MKPIHYEPHPVSPERKAELIAQGFQIIDAVFAPKDEPSGNPDNVPTREDIAKMPKSEVVEWLEAHGVEKPEGKLADLRADLIRMMFVDA